MGDKFYYESIDHVIALSAGRLFSNVYKLSREHLWHNQLKSSHGM